MDEKIERLFFALVRSAIKKELLDAEEKKNITDDIIKSMLSIAKKHDIAVVLAHALDKNNCFPEDGELKNALQKEVMMAVYRYERLNYEFKNICEVFNRNNIYHIPLKGSVLRKYYPFPWLRTSCDIDILVRPVDIDEAKKILISELNYVVHADGSHDISMFSPSKVHLELHFDLNEPKIKSYDILSNVWENTCPAKEGNYTLEIIDEVLYFYLIVHMSKHFLNGGCGVRPFIDLWIMDHVICEDKQKRDCILERENMIVFANAVRHLSNVWMSSELHTDISKKMQNYLLSGGVYGNIENKVQLQQSKTGGKFQYAIFKVFLPYEKIKYYYPILQKHKWLTPLMQVYRWFRIIFDGGVKRSIRTLKLNNSIQPEEKKDTDLFLSQIGL